jgi:serine/threonine-protein kinase
MPFVEGESLRDRLNRERQLPVEHAVRITREVASALDYAHRHGVIHRDIKPENILLHDGSAMVADFGIALAAAKTGSSRMTETGMSLGTPTYMSPEQAMGGRDIDARADIYALGCVLYEMLSGGRAALHRSHGAGHCGAGTDGGAALAPDHPAERARSPRCRGDEGARETPRGPIRNRGRVRRRAYGREGNRRNSGSTTPTNRPTATRLLSGLLIVGALAVWGWLRRDSAPVGVSRFKVELEGLLADNDDAVGISPDGRAIAYGDISTQIVLRPLDQLAATVLAGTEDGWAPFFSPDGATMGFLGGFPGDLKLLNLASGLVTKLVPDSTVAYGGSWSDDGWIYFIASEGRSLLRVRPAGGPPELVLTADSTRDEFALRHPHALPGGKGVLLTVWHRREATEIVRVDVESKTTRVLTQGVRALYLPSGHLVVVRGSGAVLAARFDPDGDGAAGQMVEMFQGVRVHSGGTPFIGISPNGTVAYGRSRPGGRLIQVERNGVATVVDPNWTGELGWPALSPDGSRLALSNQVEGRREVWIKTLPTGPFFRVAGAGSQNYRPFWAPDGRSLGFVSDLGGRSGAYRTAPDGTGAVEVIAPVTRTVDEGAWSPDGQWLVFRAGSGGGRDIMGIRPGIDSAPVPLVVSDAEEFAPSVSPDGRWLSYASNESGRDEVFVRPFPETSAGRLQVSVNGGNEPVWHPDGREIYYRDADANLVAVTFEPGPTPRVRERRVLFSARGYHTDTRHFSYAVSRDGRFYFFEQNAPSSAIAVVILNWLEELQGDGLRAGHWLRLRATGWGYGL